MNTLRANTFAAFTFRALTLHGVVESPAASAAAPPRDSAGQVDHRRRHDDEDRHGHYERTPSRDTRLTRAHWQAIEDRLRAEDAPPLEPAPPRPRAPRIDTSRARALALAALAGPIDALPPVTLGDVAPRYEYGSAAHLHFMDEEAAIAVLLGMV